ncbi:MAG: hypothetical protein ACJ77A_04850 [Actinomycetota bacterium]
MSEPIVSIDVSEIRDGKLEALKQAMEDLVGFVDANEPEPIAYYVYIDEHGTRMTVRIHGVPHEGGRPGVSQAVGVPRPSRIDIYGKPSDRLLGQLRTKARMLGNAVLAVHAPHTGFSRLEAR